MSSALAVTALVFGLAAGAALWLDNDSTERQITTDQSPAGVFPDPTGIVLIFDDGYDGVSLVDLDHRVAVRRPVEGQRAGDQPYRLTRVGDVLIVGWSEVYAVPLDGGPSRLLGDATISIPAAEPDRVWLIDYPGGRIGTGVPTLRQVDLTGEILVEAQGPDPFAFYPAIGIPGGVAFETSTGVALWDAATGDITGRLGSQQVFIADAHDNRLAWCEGPCASLHISRLDGTDLEVPAPAGGPFAARSARFSPDGRWLAAISGSRVVVIDTDTGTPRRITPKTVEQPFFVAWGPDSDRLFFSSYSYLETETHIGHYNVESDSLSATTLPFGGALDVVAVEADRLQTLLDARLGSPDNCPPPAVQPSGRSGACAFKL